MGKNKRKIAVVLVIMSAILIMSNANVLAVNDPATTAGSLKVHEEGFSKDHDMVGLFSECTESFNTGNWDIKDAVLYLNFSTTQLVNEHISDFTVSINGTYFYSQRVPSTGGEKRQVKISLPIADIVEGANSIKIESYIRTDSDLPCVDDVSKANWMDIFKDSYVALSYQSLEKTDTIADFYTQFSSIDALEYKQSMVAFNSQADNDVLSASMQALTGISKNAVLSYNTIGYRQIAAENELNVPNIIYFSKYSNLPDYLGALLSADQKAVAEKDCLMALVTMQSGNKILLVTGNDAEAMKRAGYLLGNTELMGQVKYTSKTVKSTSDVFMRQSAVDEYLSLTKTGTYVHGPFRQSADFYINYPENRLIAESSELLLSVRYSENLDFDRSLVTVYIDDKPVGSQKLEKDKADGDEIKFKIPTDLDVSGSFTLRVSFDLEIKDLTCTLRQEETPWAYISSDSQLKLNSTDVSYMLFESYPSPFVKDNTMNNVAVVLPDSPTEADYSAIGSVLLTMGRYMADNRGSLEVVKASDTGDLSDKNIITVGTFKSNAFIQGLNDKLYLQFLPGGDGLKSNEKVVLDANYSTSLGTAQLIYSPFSKEKNGLLVVSGITEESMLNAVKSLSTQESLWSVYGDAYMTDGQQVSSYRFKEENAKQLSLLEKVLEREDISTLLILIALLIIIVIFAGVILTVKYVRRGNNNEKSQK